MAQTTAHAKESILPAVGAGILTQIKKRDGRIVPFDASRITRAVTLAMEAVKEGDLKNDPARVSEAVVQELQKKYAGGGLSGQGMPDIEAIQDVVEEQLILMDFAKTAKAYILYRHKRAEVRSKTQKVPGVVKKLVRESKKYFRNPLSEFIYYRSYSRWMDSEGRRETWIESVARYIDFMRENLGKDMKDEEYEELRHTILKQEVMPSMRLLWSAGHAARVTNVAAYNCSFIAPTRLEDFAEIMYLSMCGTGVGFSVESQTAQQLPQIKMQSGEKMPTYAIEDSKEGWANALTMGLKMWYSGKDIDFDFSKLRPEGARLKTMGGRASGPGPLRDLLSFSRRKILLRQGKRLSNLDVHDIICKIGDIVVSGGVRRSALISLSDLDDIEMRHAKDGQFYIKDPQRSLANNSAVYTEKPSPTQFVEEWLALAKSGSGERGIFNRGGLKHQVPSRRWKVLKNTVIPPEAPPGTNPCVPADTWVMTTNGAERVKDLIGTPFQALADGKPYSSSGFFRTGTREIFEIKTGRGFSFRATANHRVLTVSYRSRKITRTEWKEAGALRPGDEIVLHNHENATWAGRGRETEGWLLGNLLGDGNIEKSGKVNLDYWGATQEAMMTYAVSAVRASIGTRSNATGHIAKTGYARVQSMELGRLAQTYGLAYGHKVVTEEIEKSSSEFYQGFLRGWFDADGSVQGNQMKGVSVRLSSNSLENLQAAQRMLARLGIISAIYENRRRPSFRMLPDGQGGMKSYFCGANHELVISGMNLRAFVKRVHFSDSEKEAKLEKCIMEYRRTLNRELFSAPVVSSAVIGEEDVYDCQVADVHAFDGNGVYLHNCGEIILQSKQFCNLTEVVARAEDTEETLLRKMRIATILGTYQATLTNFPYLSRDWTRNCNEERLLGVSITGQWDSPVVRNADTLKKMREESIRVNKEYAARFGIAPSTSITCVKPSGTVSQLVDSSSGMHPRHAPYYIRRVRISATDSLFHMLKDQKVPYKPEVGQSVGSANTYVIEFPVKAPPGSATFRDDLRALEQLEHWKMVKEHYTEHNPSVTVSVGDHEWLDIAHWLYGNWDMIGGLSFLPREDTVYQLAPYEAITEEQYKKMKEDFPDIDFSQIVLYEKHDETEGAKELACVAGVCEI